MKKLLIAGFMDFVSIDNGVLTYSSDEKGNLVSNSFSGKLFTTFHNVRDGFGADLKLTTDVYYIKIIKKTGGVFLKSKHGYSEKLMKNIPYKWSFSDFEIVE